MKTALRICVGIIMSPFLLLMGLGWLIFKGLDFTLGRD